MVLVIGGGGAGLYFAQKYLENHPEDKLTVVEEHKDIGKPVQCTGILTNEIEKLIPKKDIQKWTLNKITKTEIFSKNNSVTIPIKTNYIIYNTSFIKYLYDLSEKKGANILLGKRYLSNNNQITAKIRDIKTKKITEIKTKYIVGADGPNSLVAKNNNLFGERKYLTGVQAVMKFKEGSFDKEKIDFYPTIGNYAWLTPESETIARVGVATSKNPRKTFDDFTKRFNGKIIEMQGGPIPLHTPRTAVQRIADSSRIAAHRIALLGDAALQIKNTTGGGIVPGLTAARELAKPKGFINYHKNLKHLNKELYMHYLIHKVLQKYSDKDWDRLIQKVKKQDIKNILYNTNRDQALKLAFQLALRPSMSLEGLRAIKKLLI